MDQPQKAKISYVERWLTYPTALKDVSQFAVDSGQRVFLIRSVGCNLYTRLVNGGNQTAIVRNDALRSFGSTSVGKLCVDPISWKIQLKIGDSLHKLSYSRSDSSCDAVASFNHASQVERSGSAVQLVIMDQNSPKTTLLHTKIPCTGSSANLEPVWRLNARQLLIGPYRLTLPSNEDFSPYGRQNLTFFENTLDQLHRLLAEDENSLTSHAASENASHVDALPQFVHELVLSLIPTAIIRAQDQLERDAVEILLARLLDPPDVWIEKLKRFSLEQIEQYKNLVEKATNEELRRDAEDVMLLHFSTSYTTPQLLEFLVNKASVPDAVKKWYPVVMKAMKKPLTDFAALKPVLARLLPTHLELYNRCLASFVPMQSESSSSNEEALKSSGLHYIAIDFWLQHLRLSQNHESLAAETLISASSSSVDASTQDPSSSDSTEHSTNSAPSLSVDLKTDCILMAMGKSFACYSFALRSAWKYFQNYWKVMEKMEGPKTLDFKDLITPTALELLIDYFYTGDPKIVDVLDAYCLVKNAEQLLLCDDSGTPFAQHKALWFQLQVTLELDKVNTANCMRALGCAVEYKDDVMWRAAFALARDNFGALCNTAEAKWLCENYQYAFETVGWSTVTKETIEKVPLFQPSE